MENRVRAQPGMCDDAFPLTFTKPFMEKVGVEMAVRALVQLHNLHTVAACASVHIMNSHFCAKMYSFNSIHNLPCIV